MGENTERDISFSVPIRKEFDNGKTATDKFIDSFRFMPNSISKLLNNLSEIYSKRCRRCRKKKMKQYVILLSLKVIDCIINATNIKKMIHTH